MFEETKLFGISMAPRSNRRALVVITYTITAGVIASAILLGHSIPDMPGHPALKAVLFVSVWVPVLLVQIIIPGGGTFRGIFGRLVPEQTFNRRPIPALRGLGLAREILNEQPKNDEREIIVRNSAYFLAFKIIAWYAFIFLFGCVVPLAQGEGKFVRTVTAVAAIPIVVMLFTLPQAIILWTEPDIPQDDADLIAS